MIKQLLIPGLSLALACGLQADNLLRGNDFEKHNGTWYAPNYWSGTLTRVTDGSNAHSGKGALRLTAAPKGDKHFGRAAAILQLPDPAGRKFSFTLFAKGNGELAPGVLLTFPQPDGKLRYEYRYTGQPTRLTGEWQQLTYPVDLAKLAPASITPIVEVRGENAVADLDDVVFAPVVDAGASVSAATGHQLLPAGGTMPDLAFRAAPAGKEATLFLLPPVGSAQIVESRVSADGSLRYPGDALSAPGVYQGIAAVGGATAPVWIDVLAPADFDRNRALAAKVPVGDQLRILYLGDSLTDFERGHNYVDKLDFFLNAAHPGKVTSRNAGVRGDFITRVENRLNASLGRGKAEFGQPAYKDLLKQPCDLIVIFLGQNDTMCNSRDEYKTPQVAPADRDASFRRLIAELRKQSNAKILLTSSIAPNSDLCARNAEKNRKYLGTGYRFGIPEQLEAYNAAVKRLAGELGCGYLDLYTPMSAAPDRDKLVSSADGLHLTEAGNRFITRQFLEYLANESAK